jgi:radical SAM-linked protein
LQIVARDRDPGREIVPAVQKLRIQHAKRDRLRFTSHRDFQRAFERALKRAGVPMAYSAGFSPHPKISYANAAPTGVASEAEYVEIGVVQIVDPEKLLAVLDEVLPPGLDVLAVVEARTPDFVARLEASHWKIELPDTSQDALQGALDAFMSESEVLVDRMTKSGIRTFDARTAVIRANVELGADCAILQVVVRHGVPAVRPDDVLAALKKVADFAQEIPPRVTRLAQGPLLEDGWSVGDPFTLDREATQA